MHAITKAALETVAIEQRHEELEILFLAVMRSCGHQEEVPRQTREELPEVIALGVFDFAAEEGGRELVRLVADDQVPTAIRDLQLLLHVFVAREFVETGDDEVVFEEPVAGARRFELVIGQDLEGKLETAVKFVLPLLGQAAGADDEATLQVAARDQFLDEQTGHDGLACAGIVGEQEAQRLTREHGLVDGRDLVRQRLDERGMYREHRVEQMRETDTMRLRDEAEQMAVAVEAPGAAVLNDLRAEARRAGKAIRWRLCRPRSCRLAPRPPSRTIARSRR